MKKFLKGVVRSSVIQISKIFNIDVNIAIASKKHKTDFVFVDRNTLESFYNLDDGVARYKEGLKRSGMEETDNFLKQCRYYRLQELLKSTLDKGIVGSVVECGCWKGHSSYIIADILSKYNYEGKFSIFDSFEMGLSDKHPKDNNIRHELSEEDVQKEKKQFASECGELHHVLKSFNFYKIYKGWIPDRFNEIENENFIFVHIDVDLYQPTLDSLNFFYPRMRKGGVIVIDDYGYTQFPGAKKCVDEFIDKNKCSLFFAGSTGGCFIIK
jgi:O-methyltransferase